MKTLLLLTVLLFSNLCFTQETQRIQYSTYIGGNSEDYSLNIQLAANDDIIATLQATAGCVTTPGVHQTFFSGFSDVLLQKRDKNGTLIWSTYYGGNLEDIPGKVTLLKSGKIALAGQTSSIANIAFNGHQTSYGGGTYDGFLAIFNEDGTLEWATYFGGSGEDAVYGVNEDTEGNIYISGYTSSSTKISTVGSYQLLYGGGTDGFLSKFSKEGQLVWSTYVGGVGLDAFYTMEIDKSDNLWLGGLAYSSSGLVTNNAYDGSYAGRGDGLLMSFDKDGKKVYATYYGGSDKDEIYVLKIDKNDNIWFGGPTKSATDIVTAGAINELHKGDTDVFLVKFNKNKIREWATYLGGNKWDTFFGIDIDNDGNAILNMMTQSGNFSPIKNAMQETFGGGPWDAVYSKISGNGNLIWSTFHGGDGNDRGVDVKVNSEGTLIFFTTAGSQNLHTDDADDKLLNGTQDALLSIVKEEDESPVHQVQDIIPTINVYPNPATKSLALKIENPEEYIFEIYDGAGNKMIVNTNNPNHIETDLLLPGLYIVKATNRSYDFTLYKSFIKI